VLPSNSRVIGNTNPLHVAASCVCNTNITFWFNILKLKLNPKYSSFF
jgi:hypothetical protein